MATNSIITLDSRGIVTDPYQKVQLLLAYLVATQASQSNVFRDSIISIPDIIRRKGQDKLGMKSEIENAIKTTFINYFDTVDVDVGIDDKTDELEGRFNIVIQAQVTQYRKTYDIANTLAASHDKIELVSELTL